MHVGLSIWLMIDRHLIFIAKELLMFMVTGAVLLCVWGRADKQRKATTLDDGSVMFSPNRRSFFAWPVLIVYLIYATVTQVRHLHGSPLHLIPSVLTGSVAVMIAVSFPATIIVASDGLQQVSWLWKNKRLCWKDIVEINTGEKDRTITITVLDGTKIIHDRVLPDRPRMLVELRQYCGDNLPSHFLQETTPLL